MSASLAAFERPRTGAPNTVFKSGPLFISSKGIGWKSWKKRWFILTRTSLVFFKSDPSALPQRGGEVNLTLGGIDLNNSGSVVVREDKKLLTVLFPDGRDGRAFTLKADSTEDLYEWKAALEQALAQAPSVSLVMGNGIFRNDTNDTVEGSFHQWRARRPIKSLVVGRPILLALEDIDGGPSFLEKALLFLEKHGTKVEGILRLSADVEEVDQRVQEYEQGKTEFDSDEDAHTVGDCVKHVLRELPSSPVPASCCTALLEAYRFDRKEARVTAMRSAILETFPEPNRRLLQRVLKMMHTISSHSSVNRMTHSAVAACMAPLLLRPLLAGECELEDDFNGSCDNSVQLLAAANAANSAQAIIAYLLEEYESIFYDENLNRCSISADSRIENSGTDDSSDDENEETKDDGCHDAENEVDPETYDYDCTPSGKLSENSCCVGSDLYDIKAYGDNDSDVESPQNNHSSLADLNMSDDSQQFRDVIALHKEKLGRRKMGNDRSIKEMETPCNLPASKLCQQIVEPLSSVVEEPPFPLAVLESGRKPSSKLISSNVISKHSTYWGRTSVRKTSSVESVDSSGEEELVIQKLENTKNDLRHRIAKEARGNAILQASLERRKQALHERRFALEQDVARLQEELQAERDLRVALEVGLSMSPADCFSSSRGMDSKTRAELEEIALAEADVARLKQKVAELHHQLNQQRGQQYDSSSGPCGHHQPIQNDISQQKYNQDFDTTLAFCNHERKQKLEESLLGENWRNFKGQIFASASSSRQHRQKQHVDSPNLSDYKCTEASTSVSMDDLSAGDCTSVPSTLGAAETTDYHPRNPSAASSALVELTTRLDFFKERRSQLMEQLRNLDLNCGAASSQDFDFVSSPPWN